MIAVHPKAPIKRVGGDGALFVVVKRPMPRAAPTGTPLAVDKLTWPTNGELPFDMTERAGDDRRHAADRRVVVIARYDQDGDALSKQPGDIVGQARRHRAGR